MIKIKKNLENVPITLNSSLTNKRRLELVEKGEWITADIYASRYKMQDIKDALKLIYHNKCAFCERKTFAPQVEHFRPKSLYWWLSYSWDNLLRICPNCNVFKSNNFEILGFKSTFQNNNTELENIHKLSADYYEKEANLMIHPELEDIESELICLKNGKIESANPRINHTISICRLNRPDLKDERKRIWDSLLNNIKLRYLRYKKGHSSSLDSIQDIIRDFKRTCENPEAEYLAFRRYVAKNYMSTVSL